MENVCCFRMLMMNTAQQKTQIPVINGCREVRMINFQNEKV